MRPRRLLAGIAFGVAMAAAWGADGLPPSAGGVSSADPSIRIAEEYLAISPQKVRVRIVFANDADRDIETGLIIRLPDLDTGRFSREGLDPVADPANGFTANAGGKPVAFAVEQRAYVKDREVTAVLKRAGVAVNGLAGDLRLAGLPTASRQALADVGAIETAGDGIAPAWLLRTRFSWKQKFPARGRVVVTVSYRPVSARAVFGEAELENPPPPVSAVRDYCMSDAAKAAAAAKLAAQTDKPASLRSLVARRVEYPLSASGLWKGPIGRFQLSLDKTKSDAILSLCWNGHLTKISPTGFTTTERDFTPTQDIRLLILE